MNNANLQSHKFGKCKQGALARFQKEAAHVLAAWDADKKVVMEKIEAEGLQKSNVALYKTKAQRANNGMESEAREIMHAINRDYLEEIHRLLNNFGAETVDHVAKFPDGSTASVPKKLFVQERRLATLLR